MNQLKLRGCFDTSEQDWDKKKKKNTKNRSYSSNDLLQENLILKKH